MTETAEISAPADLVDTFADFLDMEDEIAEEENEETGDVADPEDIGDGPAPVAKASPDLMAALLAMFGPIPEEKYGVYQSDGRAVRLRWTGADRTQADLAAQATPDAGFGSAFVAKWTGPGDPPSTYVTDPDRLIRLGASNYYVVYVDDPAGADPLRNYENSDMASAKAAGANVFAETGRRTYLARWTGGGRPPNVFGSSNDDLTVIYTWVPSAVSGAPAVGVSDYYVVYAVDSSGADSLIAYESAHRAAAEEAASNVFASNEQERNVTLINWTGGGRPPKFLDPGRDGVYVIKTWIGKRHVSGVGEAKDPAAALSAGKQSKNVLTDVPPPAQPATNQTQRSMLPEPGEDGMRTGLKVATGAAIVLGSAIAILHFASK